MGEIVEVLSSHILFKSILFLGFVLILAWICCFAIKKMRLPAPSTSKLIRVLDVCGLENRKIILFSCPFGEGVVLLSQSGDQIHLFQKNSQDRQCEK